MDTLIIVIEAVLLLAMIALGVKTGGIGLGLWGLVGTALFIFVFGMDPGAAPAAAIGIIFAVITAAAAMQAAGGIDYLVLLAAKALRAKPSAINIVAPMISFLFTMGAGTSNIFFAIMPVINEVSFNAGERPERAMSASVVASGLGITASPVAAAMAAYIGLLPPDFTLINILMITVPASIVAVYVTSVIMSKMGKPLEEDEEFRRRVAAGECPVPAPVAERDPSILELVPAKASAGGSGSGSGDAGDSDDAGSTSAIPTSVDDLKPGSQRSAYIFFAAVAIILLLGLFPDLRPTVGTGEEAGPLSMSTTIVLVMFIAALVIILWNNVKPGLVIKQQLMGAGIVAIIALFGIAMMTDTFLSANQETIVDPIAQVVQNYPVFLAIALFIVAALTTSQSATTLAIIPFGLAAMSPAVVTAMWPSLIGVWTFPANGQQIAAVAMDRTGTTRLTSNPVWHSFTIPMLLMWVSVVAVGLLIAMVMGLF